MVTIKDIAKAAGVAQGTVSNVLNGKGNVSSEKIKHVLEIAASLGYIPNERAKLLRKGNSNIIAAILPNIRYKHYIDFYLSFKNFAESHGYIIQQYYTNDNPETERLIIQEVKSGMTAGIAVFTSCNDLQDIYAKNFQDTSPNIVFVERHPGFPCDFIGFDYSIAGTALGQRALEKGYKNICLMTGSLSLSNESAFYNSFINIIKPVNCIINHVQTDYYRKNQNILEMFNDYSPEAIFISNYGFAEKVKDICRNFYCDREPEIYTVSPIFTLPENDFTKYELNYRLLGNTVAESLIKGIEKQSPDYPIFLESAGFRKWRPDIIAPKKNVKPLNVLTLESPEAYTMKNLSKIYTKYTDVEVNITVYSYNEIYEALTNLANYPAFDVIRLDVTWLSWFAEKILLPLTAIDPHISDYFPEYLDGLLPRYSVINHQVYALPASPSVQLLYYRKDLFKDTILRRIYHETYKEELKPPATFEKFNQIARFFTKAYNPLSTVDYGATITLGSTGVAGSEFLARYFSYNENLYDSAYDISLNSESALSALEQLIEIKNYSNKKYCSWWRDTATTFAQGNVAMTILYSNYASDLLMNTSKVADNIGYTNIPGNNPVIGGGSLGISKYSSQPEAALSFVKWIGSEAVSSAATSLGSVSPRKQTYDNYEIVDTFPWLNLAKDSFSLSKGFRTPPEYNLPFDERKFLNIIGTAVKNAYSGAIKPKDALDFAQELFEKQFCEINKVLKRG